VTATRVIGIRPALLLAALLFAAPSVALAQPATPPPYEQKYHEDPFYAEIAAQAQEKSARDLIGFIQMKIQDQPERIHPAALWLRDNSIGQRDIRKVDALYFLSYFDMLHQLAGAHEKAGDRQGHIAIVRTEVLALYIYEMLATADAARCADPTAIEAMRSNTLVPRYAELGEAYALLPESDFEFFEKEALEAEEKFARRNPNAFICGLGEAKLTDMLAQQGTVTLEAPNPATGAPATRVVPPPGYEYNPIYVSDSEWEERRKEIRGHVRSIWRSRYNNLTKQ
jgi:hypothetical protein